VCHLPEFFHLSFLFFHSADIFVNWSGDVCSWRVHVGSCFRWHKGVPWSSLAVACEIVGEENPAYCADYEYCHPDVLHDEGAGEYCPV